MQKTVVVGISGGVDSSVAAYLLKQQGYKVIGVFMKNWEEDDNDSYCAAAEDIKDAEAVCKKLDIEFKTINFAAEYWDNVFEHFLSEYKAGRTPNPDILCNKEIKFKAFLAYAELLDADFIATGHYVKRGDIDNEVQLLKGIDNNKDQSYFLYTLGQAQIKKSLFPIGEYEKPKVRAIAEELGLITHNKKDSTGICFIGERKFKTFLQQYVPAMPGEIHDEHGTVIGKHDGLMFHTIGQRQGLNIGGLKGYSEKPWYVAQKDLKNNVLIAVQDSNHPLLMQDKLIATQLSWVSGKPPLDGAKLGAKVRYRQQDQACSIQSLANGDIEVNFEQPQRAITPGQSVVLYQGDICLGGGVIV